jgi:hypothetical protein
MATSYLKVKYTAKLKGKIEIPSGGRTLFKTPWGSKCIPSTTTSILAIKSGGDVKIIVISREANPLLLFLKHGNPLGE